MTLPGWLPKNSGLASPQASRIVLGNPNNHKWHIQSFQIFFHSLKPDSWNLKSEQPSYLQGTSQAASNRTGAAQGIWGSHSWARRQKLQQLLIVTFSKTQDNFFIIIFLNWKFSHFPLCRNGLKAIFCFNSEQKHTGINLSLSASPHHKTSESQLVLLFLMPSRLWKSPSELSDETEKMCATIQIPDVWV